MTALAAFLGRYPRPWRAVATDDGQARLADANGQALLDMPLAENGTSVFVFVLALAEAVNTAPVEEIGESRAPA